MCNVHVFGMSLSIRVLTLFGSFMCIKGILEFSKNHVHCGELFFEFLQSTQTKIPSLSGAFWGFWVYSGNKTILMDELCMITVFIRRDHIRLMPRIQVRAYVIALCRKGQRSWWTFGGMLKPILRVVSVNLELILSTGATRCIVTGMTSTTSTSLAPLERQIALLNSAHQSRCFRHQLPRDTSKSSRHQS